MKLFGSVTGRQRREDRKGQTKVAIGQAVVDYCCVRDKLFLLCSHTQKAHNYLCGYIGHIAQQYELDVLGVGDGCC